MRRISGDLRSQVRPLLVLAWPVVVTQVSLMAMGLVDVAMVGALGADSLAAVSIGHAVVFAILSVFMGVVMALDPLISQAYGGGRADDVRRWFWHGLWFSLAVGAIFPVLLYDTEWLLLALGQQQEVARLAAGYVQIRALSIAPFLLFTAMRSLLNGDRRVRPVMLTALGMNAVNFVLDYGLIEGRLGMPALGVQGAAWATTGVTWGMCLVIAVYLYRSDLDVLRPARPSRAWLLEMFRLGGPIGGQMLAEFGVFAAAGIFAGQLSAVDLAAHQIALSLASLNYMIPLGISIAAAVRVGRYVGAQDLKRARDAGIVAIGCGGGIMALFGLVFLCVPELLASLFSSDPEVLQLAHRLILIAAAFQIFDGVQAVAGGCLRGVGDTRAAFLANVVAHWCGGVPLGWVLAFVVGMRVDGLWWGLLASLAFVAVLLVHRFVRGRWRQNVPSPMTTT